MCSRARHFFITSVVFSSFCYLVVHFPDSSSGGSPMNASKATRNINININVITNNEVTTNLLLRYKQSRARIGDHSSLHSQFLKEEPKSIILPTQYHTLRYHWVVCYSMPLISFCSLSILGVIIHSYLLFEAKGNFVNSLKLYRSPALALPTPLACEGSSSRFNEHN